MTHVTEDELILHYYGDEMEPASARHLEECGECRKQLAALSDSLALAAADEVPERAPSYEADVWRRLEWKLQTRTRKRSAWLAAAAASILVTLGFLAGRTSLPTDPAQSAAPIAATTPQTQSAEDGVVITAAALEHLDRSSRLLVAVSNHDLSEGGELTTAGAKDLVTSNRLMRLMATRAGEREIATLLEDIEPVLLEVVHTGEETTSEDIATIQQRIERRELLFKVRVISSALRAREQADRVRPATGDTSL